VSLRPLCERAGAAAPWVHLPPSRTAAQQNEPAEPPQPCTRGAEWRPSTLRATSRTRACRSVLSAEGCGSARPGATCWHPRRWRRHAIGLRAARRRRAHGRLLMLLRGRAAVPLPLPGRPRRRPLHRAQLGRLGRGPQVRRRRVRIGGRLRAAGGHRGGAHGQRWHPPWRAHLRAPAFPQERLRGRQPVCSTRPGLNRVRSMSAAQLVRQQVGSRSWGGRPPDERRSARRGARASGLARCRSAPHHPQDSSGTDQADKHGEPVTVPENGYCNPRCT